ncbi:MAG: alpha-amylase family glycosyl hydrolase [Gemmatimonadota bacterium]|jgi:glycosidase
MPRIPVRRSLPSFLAWLSASILVLGWPDDSLAGQSRAAFDAWRGEVCYEVFVRSFFDSDGDGVGDLRGLIHKLDYVNDGDPETRDDLGAGCIWLMPVAQSPSYHGYDVTNYYAVNRDYGTEEDFADLIAEAHRRGIRILFDLVLNHTSSEHPFFKDALLDPDSPYRDWYLWSPTERSMPGWEAPTWHRNPHREEYYYGLFWSGMPDLNLASPGVKVEAARIARFWLEEMGVDGFRLDAVGHFFEDGGQWRNAPQNHPWLREYAATLDAIDPAVFTVGEVYDDLSGTLAYYPDQLDSYFVFELGDSIVTAVRQGRKQGLVAVMERIQREIPDGRWATLIRNHDQTRTMTDIGGDVGRARAAAGALLTLPGIPFVYYGEEIGMTGSKSDGDPRLRTPMQWERGPAAGFTSTTPWEPLPADSMTANVAAMEGDPGSLLNHYRRLIHLRKSHPALTAGDFAVLETGGDAGLAFLRRDEEDTALVLVNLGDQALGEVEVTSAPGALPAGSWEVEPLLGGAQGPYAVEVDGDGRIVGWTPLGGLAPYETRIFELRRRD